MPMATRIMLRRDAHRGRRDAAIIDRVDRDRDGDVGGVAVRIGDRHHKGVGAIKVRVRAVGVGAGVRIQGQRAVTRGRGFGKGTRRRQAVRIVGRQAAGKVGVLVRRDAHRGRRDAAIIDRVDRDRDGDVGGVAVRIGDRHHKGVGAIKVRVRAVGVGAGVRIQGQRAVTRGRGFGKGTRRRQAVRIVGRQAAGKVGVLVRRDAHRGRRDAAIIDRVDRDRDGDVGGVAVRIGDRHHKGVGAIKVRVRAVGVGAGVRIQGQRAVTRGRGFGKGTRRRQAVRIVGRQAAGKVGVLVRRDAHRGRRDAAIIDRVDRDRDGDVGGVAVRIGDRHHKGVGAIKVRVRAVGVGAGVRIQGQRAVTRGRGFGKGTRRRQAVRIVGRQAAGKVGVLVRRDAHRGRRDAAIIDRVDRDRDGDVGGVAVRIGDRHHKGVGAIKVRVRAVGVGAGVRIQGQRAVTRGRGFGKGTRRRQAVRIVGRQAAGKVGVLVRRDAHRGRRDAAIIDRVDRDRDGDVGGVAVRIGDRHHKGVGAIKVRVRAVGVGAGVRIQGQRAVTRGRGFGKGTRRRQAVRIVGRQAAGKVGVLVRRDAHRGRRDAAIIDRVDRDRDGDVGGVAVRIGDRHHKGVGAIKVRVRAVGVGAGVRIQGQRAVTRGRGFGKGTRRRQAVRIVGRQAAGKVGVLVRRDAHRGRRDAAIIDRVDRDRDGDVGGVAVRIGDRHHKGVGAIKVRVRAVGVGAGVRIQGQRAVTRGRGFGKGTRRRQAVRIVGRQAAGKVGVLVRRDAHRGRRDAAIIDRVDRDRDGDVGGVAVRIGDRHHKGVGAIKVRVRAVGVGAGVRIQGQRAVTRGRGFGKGTRRRQAVRIVGRQAAGKVGVLVRRDAHRGRRDAAIIDRVDRDRDGDVGGVAVRIGDRHHKGVGAIKVRVRAVGVGAGVRIQGQRAVTRGRGFGKGTRRRQAVRIVGRQAAGKVGVLVRRDAHRGRRDAAIIDRVDRDRDGDVGGVAVRIGDRHHKGVGAIKVRVRAVGVGAGVRIQGQRAVTRGRGFGKGTRRRQAVRIVGRQAAGKVGVLVRRDAHRGRRDAAIIDRVDRDRDGDVGGVAVRIGDRHHKGVGAIKVRVRAVGVGAGVRIQGQRAVTRGRGFGKGTRRRQAVRIVGRQAAGKVGVLVRRDAHRGRRDAAIIDRVDRDRDGDVGGVAVRIGDRHHKGVGAIKVRVRAVGVGAGVRIQGQRAVTRGRGFGKGTRRRQAVRIVGRQAAGKVGVLVRRDAHRGRRDAAIIDRVDRDRDGDVGGVAVRIGDRHHKGVGAIKVRVRAVGVGAGVRIQGQRAVTRGRGFGKGTRRRQAVRIVGRQAAGKVGVLVRRDAHRGRRDAAIIDRVDRDRDGDVGGVAVRIGDRHHKGVGAIKVRVRAVGVGAGVRIQGQRAVTRGRGFGKGTRRRQAVRIVGRQAAGKVGVLVRRDAHRGRRDAAIIDRVDRDRDGDVGGVAVRIGDRHHKGVGAIKVRVRAVGVGAGVRIQGQRAVTRGRGFGKGTRRRQAVRIVGRQAAGKVGVLVRRDAHRGRRDAAIIDRVDRDRDGDVGGVAVRIGDRHHKGVGAIKVRVRAVGVGAGVRIQGQRAVTRGRGFGKGTRRRQAVRIVGRQAAGKVGVLVRRDAHRGRRDAAIIDRVDRDRDGDVGGVAVRIGDRHHKGVGAIKVRVRAVGVGAGVRIQGQRAVTRGRGFGKGTRRRQAVRIVGRQAAGKVGVLVRRDAHRGRRDAAIIDRVDRDRDGDVGGVAVRIGDRHHKGVGAIKVRVRAVGVGAGVRIQGQRAVTRGRGFGKGTRRRQAVRIVGRQAAGKVGVLVRRDAHRGRRDAAIIDRVDRDRDGDVGGVAVRIGDRHHKGVGAIKVRVRAVGVGAGVRIQGQRAVTRGRGFGKGTRRRQAVRIVGRQAAGKVGVLVRRDAHRGRRDAAIIDRVDRDRDGDVGGVAVRIGDRHHKGVGAIKVRVRAVGVGAGVRIQGQRAVTRGRGFGKGTRRRQAVRIVGRQAAGKVGVLVRRDAHRGRRDAAIIDRVDRDRDGDVGGVAVRIGDRHHKGVGAIKVRVRAVGVGAGVRIQGQRAVTRGRGFGKGTRRRQAVRIVGRQAAGKVGVLVRRDAHRGRRDAAIIDRVDRDRDGDVGGVAVRIGDRHHKGVGAIKVRVRAVGVGAGVRIQGQRAVTRGRGFGKGTRRRQAVRIVGRQAAGKVGVLVRRDAHRGRRDAAIIDRVDRDRDGDVGGVAVRIGDRHHKGVGAIKVRVRAVGVGAGVRIQGQRAVTRGRGFGKGTRRRQAVRIVGRQAAGKVGVLVRRDAHRGRRDAAIIDRVDRDRDGDVGGVAVRIGDRHHKGVGAIKVRVRAVGVGAGVRIQGQRAVTRGRGFGKGTRRRQAVRIVGRQAAGKVGVLVRRDAHRGRRDAAIIDRVDRDRDGDVGGVAVRIGDRHHKGVGAIKVRVRAVGVGAGVRIQGQRAVTRGRGFGKGTRRRQAVRIVGRQAAGKVGVLVRRDAHRGRRDAAIIDRVDRDRDGDVGGVAVRIGDRHHKGVGAIKVRVRAVGVGAGVRIQGQRAVTRGRGFGKGTRRRQAVRIVGRQAAGKVGVLVRRDAHRGRRDAAIIDRVDRDRDGDVGGVAVRIGDRHHKGVGAIKVRVRAVGVGAGVRIQGQRAVTRGRGFGKGTRRRQAVRIVGRQAAGKVGVLVRRDAHRGRRDAAIIDRVDRDRDGDVGGVAVRIGDRHHKGVGAIKVRVRAVGVGAGVRIQGQRAVTRGRGFGKGTRRRQAVRIVGRQAAGKVGVLVRRDAHRGRRDAAIIDRVDRDRDGDVGGVAVRIGDRHHKGVGAIKVRVRAVGVGAGVRIQGQRAVTRGRGFGKGTRRRQAVRIVGRQAAGKVGVLVRRDAHRGRRDAAIIDRVDRDRDGDVGGVAVRIGDRHHKGVGAIKVRVRAVGVGAGVRIQGQRAVTRGRGFGKGTRRRQAVRP